MSAGAEFFIQHFFENLLGRFYQTNYTERNILTNEVSLQENVHGMDQLKS